MTQTLISLNEIFQNYFDDNEIQLKSSTSASDIEDWDSLAQVGLIILIEKKFGIRFSSPELEQLSNIGDMVNLIDEKS